VRTIVVIEHGTDIERGTHAQLMRLEGRYAQYVADSER
jgi:ABC-type multidrug transport system fused ATPase/permease subunit